MYGDADVSTINPVTRKLSRFARLSVDERAILDRLTANRRQTRDAREYLFVEGSQPRGVNIILTGWACRYKLLENGRRQIIAVLLPGDFCSPYNMVSRMKDHSLAALTRMTFVNHSSDISVSAVHDFPRLQTALLWDVEASVAIANEWIVNLGQRNGFDRVAHLLCELYHRLRRVDMVNGARCELPMTQIELAEAMGMTPIHINRILQELRTRKLIELNGKHLAIPDLDALQQVCAFSTGYLELEQEFAQPDNLS